MREGEPRAEKVAAVDEVKERLSSSSAALLTEYRGLKVGELADLRRRLRAAGGEYKVYKNSLVRFAVRDLGLAIDDETLTGPTAIAFIDGDAAAVAKALRDYSRTNANLVLKGGILGDKTLTVDETRALAELPSREVLLAQLAGAFQAPLTKLAGLLQALPRNMAYGLKALIDQRVEGGEAPPESASAGEGQPAEPEEAPAAVAEAPAAGAATEAPTEAEPSEAEKTDAEAPAAANETDAEVAASAQDAEAPAEAENAEAAAEAQEEAN